MSVMLRSSRDLGDVARTLQWVPMPNADVSILDPRYERKGVAELFERAFDAQAEMWWSVGKELSADPTAALAHMPATVTNVSDFGQMLAWLYLIGGWCKEDETTLVVCDDPWLFRQIRDLPGTDAGSAPSLIYRALPLAMRGFLARIVASVRFAANSVLLRPQRNVSKVGGGYLIVYGHPTSKPRDYDGYFGTLPADIPAIRRVLHVDCALKRARYLSSQGDCQSLHGYGSLLFALLKLPLASWRPSIRIRLHPYGWLIRRAIAQEGSTAQAAAIRWQLHCQERWMRRCRPTVVAWPWENHNWERSLVRAARRVGCRTVGYQHSVVGRQMLNYASFSNIDGRISLPDKIICTGPATRDQLVRWGHAEDRVSIGGALRFQNAKATYDPEAPIFVALPFDARISGEMLLAIRDCSGPRRKFIVKDHPMTPFVFDDTNFVVRTHEPLHRQKAVSAVVYAATTVGLEAILNGIPTIRFRSARRLALDILPIELSVLVAERETLADTLDRVSPPQTIDPVRNFAPVDLNLWRSVLSPTTG